MTKSIALDKPMTPLCPGALAHINDAVLSPDNAAQKHAKGLDNLQFFLDFFRSPQIHFIDNVSLSDFIASKTQEELLAIFRVAINYPLLSINEVFDVLNGDERDTLLNWDNTDLAAKQKLVPTLIQQNTPLLRLSNQPTAGNNPLHQLQSAIAQEWFLDSFPKARHHLGTFRAIQRFHTQFTFGLGLTLLLETYLPHLREFCNSHSNLELSRKINFTKDRCISIIYDEKSNGVLYRVSSRLTLTVSDTADDIDLGTVEYYLTIQREHCQHRITGDTTTPDGLFVEHKDNQYLAQGFAVTRMAYSNPILAKLLSEKDPDSKRQMMLQCFTTAILDHHLDPDILAPQTATLSDCHTAQLTDSSITQPFHLDRKKHVILLVDYAIQNNLALNYTSLHHIFDGSSTTTKATSEALFDLLVEHYRRIRAKHDYELPYYSRYVCMLIDFTMTHELPMDFTGLNLSNLNLSGIVARGIILQDSDLCGTLLDESHLEYACFEGAKMDTRTRLNNTGLKYSTGQRLIFYFDLFKQHHPFIIQSGVLGFPSTTPVWHVKNFNQRIDGGFMDPFYRTILQQVKIHANTFLSEGKLTGLFRTIERHLPADSDIRGHSLSSQIDDALQHPHGTTCQAIFSALTTARHADSNVAQTPLSFFTLPIKTRQNYCNREEPRLPASNEELPLSLQ